MRKLLTIVSVLLLCCSCQPMSDAPEHAFVSKTASSPDVYLGQVMLAVRPNWFFADTPRKNMQCTLAMKISRAGEVQDCKVTASSGNAQYDASCVDAVMRTSRAGDFPPPPKPEYGELECVFTLNDLMGR